MPCFGECACGVKLAEWSRWEGVHPQTVYRWFREGTWPVPAVRMNQRTVLVNPGSSDAPVGGVGLYARVSSHDQRVELDRLVALLREWAAAANAPVVRVETEVGSAMNGARRKVRRLLSDSEVTAVVVEHRDRLGRVNTELVDAAPSAHGRRLVALDSGEVTDDLVRDMVEVLTSLSARLYGRRSARNRAFEAVGCGRRDVGPAAVVGAVGEDGGHG
jgi:putative resolvase